MSIVWKDVVGAEGFYEVSSCGVVRGIDRYIQTRGQGTRFVPSKVLKTAIDRYGYEKVALNLCGKKLYKTVHRMVMEAYTPNPDNLPSVNHKDSDKMNNDISNLEWVTVAENNAHSFRNNPTKVVSMSKGAASRPQSTYDDIYERAFLKAESSKSIGDLHGFETHHVNLMLRRKILKPFFDEYIENNQRRLFCPIN